VRKIVNATGRKPGAFVFQGTYDGAVGFGIDQLIEARQACHRNYFTVFHSVFFKDVQDNPILKSNSHRDFK
jgi:hypothetical protein